MSNGIIMSFNECYTIEHLVTNDKDYMYNNINIFHNNCIELFCSLYLNFYIRIILL